MCGSLSLSEWFTRSLLRSFLHKPQHSKHTRLHKSQNAETRSVLNTKTCFGTNSETNIYLHDVMMPMCYVKRRDSTSHINVAGAELPSHAASSSSSTVMPKLVLVLWLLVRARGLDLVDLVEPPASKAQSRGGLVSRTPVLTV